MAIRVRFWAALACWVLLAVAVRPPEAFASAALDSVSCASPGNCTAVGSYDGFFGRSGLLLTKTGGVWAPGIEAPLPATTGPYPGGSGLSSVSCASPGNCSAVGEGFFGHHEPHAGLLFTEAAGAWAAYQASESVWDINSVSCGSPGYCSAVGSFVDSSDHVLLLSESGGVWAPGIAATLPSNAGAAFCNGCVGPSSVSCASAGNCSAVGLYIDGSGGEQGLLLSEIGGTWAPGVEATLPANAGTRPNADLTSVSCASAGDCTAVGSYFDSSPSQRGLLLTETNGGWAPGVEAMLPANAVMGLSVSLESVSCASPGNCTAVGSYSSSDGPQALMLTETGGTWGPGVEASLPATAGTNPRADLGSVSCASAGNCTAVGSYVDNSGNTRGLLLTESNGVWAPGVEAPLPANAAVTSQSVRVASVSCPAVGDCDAVGSYVDSAGLRQGLLLTEADGNWAPGVEAKVPANTGPALSGLRVSPKTFVLAGRRVNGRCVKQTRANRTDRRCTRRIKLTISYSLISAAHVAFTVTRLAPGRRVSGRCVKPTNANKRHRRCTRSVHVPGIITLLGTAGANGYTFAGRIGGHKLAAASYRLTVTLKEIGRATSRAIGFKIVAHP